jgi:UDP-glucuronate decarboxylase
VKKTSELLDHPYFEMVRHDITEPHYAEVDEIYNWPVARTVHYQYNPIKTIKTSVMELLMFWVYKRVKAKVLQYL